MLHALRQPEERQGANRNHEHVAESGSLGRQSRVDGLLPDRSLGKRCSHVDLFPGLFAAAGIGGRLVGGDGKGKK
jgi:hypothetical protein